MSVSPQKSNETLGWRFVTSFGAWGPLYTSYYDVVRAELPNEKAFWAGLVRPHASVLEIGAGTGFISEVLAMASPKLLTLVEPEFENISILKRKLQKWPSAENVNVVASQFENATIAPQDLIVFPYDTLPMITNKRERAELIRIVAERLIPGGQFVMHISTAKWAEKYLYDNSVPKTTLHLTPEGEELEVKRFAKTVSSSEYIKFVSIRSDSRGEQENYVGTTSIVTDREVLDCAEAVGLKLRHLYSDFFKTKSVSHSISSEDSIFVFEKTLR